MMRAVALLALQLLAADAGLRPAVEKFVASETVRDPAIDDFLRRMDDQQFLKPDDVYFYNKVDLNGEGEPEAIVYLMSNGYCGSSGCVLFVLRKNHTRYDSIGDISGSWLPVVVAARRTGGWHDLIVWKRGYSDEPSRYDVLRWNGETYDDSGRRLSEPLEGVGYLNNPREPQFGVRIAIGNQ